MQDQYPRHQPWCGTPDARPGHGCGTPSREFDGVHVAVLDMPDGPVVSLVHVERDKTVRSAVLPLKFAPRMASVLGALGHCELAAAVTSLCELATPPPDDRVMNPTTHTIEHLPAGAKS